MFIVGLVEEYVLAVEAFRGKFFQCSILSNTMLAAKVFPKLCANLVAALPSLQRDQLAPHGRSATRLSREWNGFGPQNFLVAQLFYSPWHLVRALLTQLDVVDVVALLDVEACAVDPLGAAVCAVALVVRGIG